MTLPIRKPQPQTKTSGGEAYPPELRIELASEAEAMPVLHGELETATLRPLRLVLRVHNQAGIPILEAHSQLPAGQRQFTFDDLRPLGIEAYAHKSTSEQQAVARRIWSRRAYGTLTIIDAS